MAGKPPKRHGAISKATGGKYLIFDRHMGLSDVILLKNMEKMALTHLRALEAESIHTLREVVAEFARPVMLYSIGKDSSVMVRLAQKAFFPDKIPFPLLHVDTGWKFRDMISFRDEFCQKEGFDLRVYKNDSAEAAGMNPL